MPKTIFSSFHENTILSDAQELHESSFERSGGLLGLFYKRSEDNSKTVRRLSDRFTAEDLADKIALDIEYWYDIEVQICNVTGFEGLQHSVHKQGAAITWQIQS